MQRELTFGVDGRKKVLAGIEKTTDAISVTFGGAGRNVLIEKVGGYPFSTKDGVTVAKSIELKDRLENMGALVVREAASKTVDIAGDGTTCASILTYYLIQIGMRYIEKNKANPVEMKRGMDLAVERIVAHLQTISMKADTEQKLTDIATVSANNDREIGSLISKAINTVGREGIVEVEEAKGYETTIEIVEGMQLDRGYISPYFINNEKKGKCELDNPMILLYEKKINLMKEFAPILTEVSKTGRPLLIISEDLSEEVLKTLVINKVQNGFPVCAIKLPTFGGSKKLVMEDLAILTNGKFMSEEKGDSIKKASIIALGSAEKVIITKDKTTIIGGKGGKAAVDARCEQIKSEMEQSENEFEKGKMKERIAKLGNGVAVIKVGGATEMEILEKKDRIDDALCATRSAMDEGYIPGGGIAYINCAKSIKSVSEFSENEQYGIATVLEAIRQPFRIILENAGLKSQDFIKEFGKFTWDGLSGVNVKTGKWCNLLDAGIIDPAKVARVALENAASVAGVFLTTECVISNLDQ